MPRPSHQATWPPPDLIYCAVRSAAGRRASRLRHGRLRLQDLGIGAVAYLIRPVRVPARPVALGAAAPAADARRPLADVVGTPLQSIEMQFAPLTASHDFHVSIWGMPFVGRRADALPTLIYLT